MHWRFTNSIAEALAGVDDLQQYEQDEDLVRDYLNIPQIADRIRRRGLIMLKLTESSLLPVILHQAARAYCFGLYGAVAILCRTALETALVEKFFPPITQSSA